MMSAVDSVCLKWVKLSHDCYQFGHINLGHFFDYFYKYTYTLSLNNKPDANTNNNSFTSIFTIKSALNCMHPAINFR